MSAHNEGHAKEVDSVINQAIKKSGVKKENDLCRYIPGPSGGYIHHFTLRKMRTDSPQKLISLLTKHIIQADKPTKLHHKPRAPRGSRKRLELLNFSRQDMDRLMHMVRMSGDKEMIRKLTPRRDFKATRRELISSIRQGRVDPELWNAYCESVTSQNAYATAPQQHAAL